MRSHARRGLSLIEVLIAMAIMALSILALVPLFAMSVKTNASSGQLAFANTLAREKLEQLIGCPSTDDRLAIPSGGTIAASAETCTARPGYTPPSGCVVSTWCENDLPLWWQPATGAVSKAAVRPSIDYFPYPCTRTYTVQGYLVSNLANAKQSTASSESGFNTSPSTRYYDIKLVTVTVQPAKGPFPGLRRTSQSAYVKFRWRQ